MSQDDTPQHRDLVRTICDELRGQPDIGAQDIADEFMRRIGFTREMHPAGYFGCHTTARQMAEEYLWLGGDQSVARAQAEAVIPDDPEIAEALRRHADALRAETLRLFGPRKP